jgi:long-chain acyl-CoA synthetase
MRTYSLYDVFVRNDNISGDETALVDGDDRLSFHELHESVVKTANVLAEKGVGKGDTVAALAMNKIGFFILLGALAKLGAILVPLNWRLSNGELSYILSDCSPQFLFSDHTHRATATEIAKGVNIPILDIDCWRPEEKEKSQVKGIIGFTDEVVDGDSPLCIIYTAAVAGRPRGAVLSHSNLIAANMQVIIELGLSATDVNLNMLPLFHITGLNLALAVMQVGGRNIVIDKFDEEKTLKLTAAEKVTLWGSFPPILSRAMALYEKGSHNISSLKYVVGLDGPEVIASFEQLTEAKFWILYGQSETSGFVTFSPASNKKGSAGRQGCLSSFCLMDETGQAVGPGEIGEIVVRGPLVFQGYWKQDEVNDHTFRNGCHHTGDLGQVDEDGYLYFKGRKPEKELIKPGGENVYPAEVEAAVLEHPAVMAVCVIGVPDPQFGEGVKAVCVLKSGQQLSGKELTSFVGGRIAGYKKPRYVEFVDDLPRKNDQIDREKVKQMWG